MLNYLRTIFHPAMLINLKWKKPAKQDEMSVLHGNIFKPRIHFDKYKNLTLFPLHHKILSLANIIWKILSGFILKSLYHENNLFVSFPNTKLYIGYGIQTTES